mmetsp:Transcript_21399/g.57321  ORF Transcript_21399/g.57321 Transcript_21399/m.57321 type:complete len:83 (+) Transcript_21399:73-321(+)
MCLPPRKTDNLRLAQREDISQFAHDFLSRALTVLVGHLLDKFCKCVLHGPSWKRDHVGAALSRSLLASTSSEAAARRESRAK